MHLVCVRTIYVAERSQNRKASKTVNIHPMTSWQANVTGPKHLCAYLMSSSPLVGIINCDPLCGFYVDFDLISRLPLYILIYLAQVELSVGIFYCSLFKS